MKRLGNPELGVTAAIEGDPAAIEGDPEVGVTGRSSPCWRQSDGTMMFFSFHCVEGRSDFHVAEV